MPIDLNSAAYMKLIDEDIEWLLENSEHSLEREHILMILNQEKRNFLSNGD